MNIPELLETILKESSYLGTFPLDELLRFAAHRSINGIAVAKDSTRERYLAFVKGEPEGAIYIDPDGTLYGDKAIMLIGGKEPFVLWDVKPDIVDALVMSAGSLKNPISCRASPVWFRKLASKVWASAC